ALSAMGLRRAGTLSAREALRAAAARLIDPALLWRDGLRLLLRLPGDVPLLRQHDAPGRDDDDRHLAVPEFRAAHVLRLRRRLRAARGRRAAGAHRTGAARQAEELPRVRSPRRLHHRSVPDASGCSFPIAAGHSDVSPLRRRPHYGAHTAASARPGCRAAPGVLITKR